MPTHLSPKGTSFFHSRARAFASYRFGDEEHHEYHANGSGGSPLGAQDRLPTHRNDDFKYHTSRSRRLWTKVRTLLFRGRRSKWVSCIALILFLRWLFGGKDTSPITRGSKEVNNIPVLRKSISERAMRAAVEGVEDLIIVPGHAVYLSSNFRAAREEANWILEPFQLLEGEAKAFIKHMEIGVREVAANPEALLIFSGGKTRREAGAMSEASSYWQVSRAFEWFGADVGVESRVFTEEHARDSFENVLFSMCRFYELTGRFPRKITVVGFASKRERFEKQHLGALRFPLDRFRYIGTDAINQAEMTAGEVKIREAFSRDPYGCRGELAAKKVNRDPYNEGCPYVSQVKLLRGLWIHITTCSQRTYTGTLPWLAGVIVR